MVSPVSGRGVRQFRPLFNRIMEIESPMVHRDVIQGARARFSEAVDTIRAKNLQVSIKPDEFDSSQRKLFEEIGFRFEEGAPALLSRALSDSKLNPFSTFFLVLCLAAEFDWPVEPIACTAGFGLRIIGAETQGKDIKLNSSFDPQGSEKSIRESHPESIRQGVYEKAMSFAEVESVVFLSRSVMRISDGDGKGAEEDLNKALTLHPKNVAALFSRVILKIGRGDIKGAEIDLINVINLDPGLIDAYERLIAIKIMVSRDYAGAVEVCDRAIKNGVNKAELYCMRASGKLMARDFNGAENDYSESIRLSAGLEPKNISILYSSRATARIQLGDLDKAMEDCNEAIKYDPGNEEAVFRRGEVRMFMEDHSGAKEDFENAIKLGLQNPVAHLHIGAINMKTGNIMEAIEILSRCIERYPVYALAYNNRATARIAKGDKQGALKDFDLAIEINPFFAEAFFSRANLRKSLGDDEGAEEDMNKVKELMGPGTSGVAEA